MAKKSSYFGEGEVSLSVNGNLVVVIESDQIREAQMASKRGSFRADSFHHATVSKEDEGLEKTQRIRHCLPRLLSRRKTNLVVKQSVSWLVVDSTQVSLSDGETDSVCDSLTKRASSNLDTVGFVVWS